MVDLIWIGSIFKIGSENRSSINKKNDFSVFDFWVQFLRLALDLIN